MYQLVNERIIMKGKYHWYVQHGLISTLIYHFQKLDRKKKTIMHFMIIFTSNFRKGKTIGTKSKPVFPCYWGQKDQL